jgi:hypothetical protein
MKKGAYEYRKQTNKQTNNNHQGNFSFPTRQTTSRVSVENITREKKKGKLNPSKKKEVFKLIKKEKEEEPTRVFMWSS